MPMVIIIILAVICTTPYLIDKGQLTVLYKINNNVHIKTSKIIKYIFVTLYSSMHTYTPTPTGL